MGNGMNKILPGLYVGNFRDSRDTVQLTKNRITHIISIHDNAKPLLVDKKYLCITASDSAEQDLLQYFAECIRFIHTARHSGGGVLVHCLAGVSRSVTITVAYVMTVTDLGWREALNVVRSSRTCAGPNFGFQRQLHEYQFEKVAEERVKLRAEFEHEMPFDDKAECERMLEAARQAAAAAQPGTRPFSCAEIRDPDPTHNKVDGAASSNCTADNQVKAKSSVDCASMWSALNEDLATKVPSESDLSLLSSQSEVKSNSESEARTSPSDDKSKICVGSVGEECSVLKSSAAANGVVLLDSCEGSDVDKDSSHAALPTSLNVLNKSASE